MDVSSALAALHNQGLFHGDVHPDNIIFRENDQAFVLIDFDKSGDTERLSTASFAPGWVDDRFHIPSGLDGRRAGDCIALVGICVQLVAGVGNWIRRFEGGFDFSPAETHLVPWLRCLNDYWQTRDRRIPDVGSLRDRVEAAGRGIFVGGATTDTKEIRDQLYNRHALFAQWHMQDRFEPAKPAQSTVSQIYQVINRSRVVVLLLGQAHGSPAEGVAGHLLEKAREVGWADDLTYTECEYLIASELNKPIIFCEVTSGSPLRIRNRTRGMDPPLNVNKENCVETIRKALEDRLGGNGHRLTTRAPPTIGR